MIQQLKGHAAIGHNRYATTGETMLRNVQPLFAEFEFGGFAVGHNGNLTNAYSIRKQLVQRGCIFQSTTDTEIIIHLIAISQFSNVVDRIIDALHQVEREFGRPSPTRVAHPKTSMLSPFYRAAGVSGQLAPFFLDLSGWNSHAALTFALTGLFFPVAATLLGFEANRRMGPGTAGALSGTTPVFASAGAIVFLGEHLTTSVVMGTLVVVAGGALLSMGGRSAPRH